MQLPLLLPHIVVNYAEVSGWEPILFNHDFNVQPNEVTRVIFDPTAVINRLKELEPSLDSAVFLEANRRGFEARLEITPSHAPTAAGTYHWHEFVASLRSELLTRGWSRKDHKNCPFIISPDGAVTILVMTGNEDTGKQFGTPRNQADKGAVVNEAVLQNQAQYELFENAAISALERGKNGTQLWVLLYHVDRDFSDLTQVLYKEIRAELSLPNKFDRKKIMNWAERLILPSIVIDPSPEIAQPVPSAPIDVPVQRKG